jgi:hypothetical protein
VYGSLRHIRCGPACTSGPSPLSTLVGRAHPRVNAHNDMRRASQPLADMHVRVPTHWSGLRGGDEMAYTSFTRPATLVVLARPLPVRMPSAGAGGAEHRPLEYVAAAVRPQACSAAPPRFLLNSVTTSSSARALACRGHGEAHRNRAVARPPTICDLLHQRSPSPEHLPISRLPQIEP